LRPFSSSHSDSIGIGRVAFRVISSMANRCVLPPGTDIVTEFPSSNFQSALPDLCWLKRHHESRIRGHLAFLFVLRCESTLVLSNKLRCPNLPLVLRAANRILAAHNR